MKVCTKKKFNGYLAGRGEIRSKKLNTHIIEDGRALCGASPGPKSDLQGFVESVLDVNCPICIQRTEKAGSTRGGARAGAGRKDARKQNANINARIPIALETAMDEGIRCEGGGSRGEFVRDALAMKLTGMAQESEDAGLKRAVEAMS